MKSLWERLENTSAGHAAVLLFAFVVRLLGIHSRPFHYDDVFSIFLAQRSLPEIVRGTAADTMPPLYYFLLHFWIQFSESDWFIRLLTVILSLLAIWLLMNWVQEMNDRRTALVAGFLAAISPFHFYHAQDVRNYALLLCAQTAFLWFFVRLWKVQDQPFSHQIGNWTGLVLSGTIAMYTHNVAILGLAPVPLYLSFRRKWRFLLQITAAFLIIALLSVPWLAVLPAQLAKIRYDWWLWRPGVVDWLQIPLVWVTGLPLTGIWLWIGALIALETFVLVWVEVLRRYVIHEWMALLWVVMLGVPVLFFIGSYLFKPIFVPRGFIISSFAFLAMASSVIVQRWKQGAGKLILSGFVLGALIGIPIQVGFLDFPRAPFQQVARDLETRLTPGEVVVHDNKLSYFPVKFYNPRLPQVFLADIPGSGNDTFARGSQEAMQIFPQPDIQHAVQGFRRVYFVVFQQAIQDYQRLGYGEHPALIWLRSHAVEEDRMNYRDLWIYVFRFP
ncbi:MAG: glycosyltransferase family 39 protein [Anaerolinea sp.]